MLIYPEPVYLVNPVRAMKIIHIPFLEILRLTGHVEIMKAYPTGSTPWLSWGGLVAFQGVRFGRDRLILGTDFLQQRAQG
jgi:hypothetical protein